MADRHAEQIMPLEGRAISVPGVFSSPLKNMRKGDGVRPGLEEGRVESGAVGVFSG
jgi:hypothetical protein